MRCTSLEFSMSDLRIVSATERPEKYRTCMYTHIILLLELSVVKHG